MRLYCSISADAVNSLALTPLLFGAAWKILDLFVELALNLSGAKPKRRNWTIEEKVTAAKNGLELNSLLMDVGVRVLMALAGQRNISTDHTGLY